MFRGVVSVTVRFVTVNLLRFCHVAFDKDVSYQYFSYEELIVSSAQVHCVTTTIKGVEMAGISFEEVGRNGMVSNRVRDRVLSDRVMDWLKDKREVCLSEVTLWGIFIEEERDDIVFLANHLTDYAFGEKPISDYQIVGVIRGKEVSVPLSVPAREWVGGYPDFEVLAEILVQFIVSQENRTVSLKGVRIGESQCGVEEVLNEYIPEVSLSGRTRGCLERLLGDWLVDEVVKKRSSTSVKHLFAKEGEDTVLLLTETQIGRPGQDFALEYAVEGLVCGREVVVRWRVADAWAKGVHEIMAAKILGVEGDVVHIEQLSGSVYPAPVNWLSGEGE